MFIIHIGTSGFPTGNNAVIQRIRLIFKGLKHAGVNPLIVSKHSVYKTGNTKKISRFQGIPYISTSKLLNRPDNFIVRNLNRLSGYLGEFIFLVKKRKKIHTAILSGSSFTELVYYRILSKMLHFQLVIQYVEFYSAIESRKKLFTHIDDLLLDNYRFYFCDGIIVISEFLKKHTLTRKKSLPIIKIPAICDFDEFNLQIETSQDKYMMYCGSIAYLSVIEFIIELYCKLKQSDSYQGKLLLVLGGFGINGEFDGLYKKINESGHSDTIVVKTNLPHKDLIKVYLGAELLIVPMRNSVQDIAGFHHKIGEYCAAKKPIISTNYGELSYYFKDSVSAILAEEYTIDSYYQKLTKILPLKEKLNMIGTNGYKVGSVELNYLNNGIKLREFIFNNRA